MSQLTLKSVSGTVCAAVVNAVKVWVLYTSSPFLAVCLCQCVHFLHPLLLFSYFFLFSCNLQYDDNSTVVKVSSVETSLVCTNTQLNHELSINGRLMSLNVWLREIKQWDMKLLWKILKVMPKSCSWCYIV